LAATVNGWGSVTSSSRSLLAAWYSRTISMTL